MDAKETVRCWLVGCQSMSSLPDGGRHREAPDLPLAKMYEVRREIPEAFRKLEQKARTSKKEWKWQRGIVVHPLRGHFSMRKWVSEKHNNWGIPVEGFKDHVATDGSLLGAAGKRGSMWLVSGATGL